MDLSIEPRALRRWFWLTAVLLASQLGASTAVAADDGLVVGVVEWQPNIPFAEKTSWDKTDYWASIAVSPSTGKYAASCEWTSRELLHQRGGALSPGAGRLLSGSRGTNMA